MQVHDFGLPSPQNKRKGEIKPLRKELGRHDLQTHICGKDKRQVFFNLYCIVDILNLQANKTYIFILDDLNRNNIQTQKGSERCKKTQKSSTLFFTGQTTSGVLQTGFRPHIFRETLTDCNVFIRDKIGQRESLKFFQVRNKKYRDIQLGEEKGL